MELIKPEVGLIFWTVITFLALLFVLKKLAWKPLLSMLEERETKIKTSLEQAEQAKTDAEALVAEHRKTLAETRGKIAEMLETSRKEAETLKAEFIEKAKREATEIVERGKLEIQNEKEKAVRELKKTTVELALSAAEKLMKTSLREEGHKKLVLETIEDIEKTKEI